MPSSRRHLRSSTMNPSPEAAPSAVKKTRRISAGILLSGYLMNRKQIAYLCRHAYGFTDWDFKQDSPVDLAARYYDNHTIMDSPEFVPITHYLNDNPGVLLNDYVLLAKLAFCKPGQKRPRMPLDERTKAYIDAWLPPALLETEELKGLRYVEAVWPRSFLPSVCVNRKMRERQRSKTYFQDMQTWGEDCIEWQKAKGVENPVLPPRLPVMWFV